MPGPRRATRPLSLRDLRLITLLAEGVGAIAAAKALGMSYDKVYRRMHRPNFKAMLETVTTAHLTRVAETIGERIIRDTPRTWQFLTDVMDGKVTTQTVMGADGTPFEVPISPDMLRVRVQAARALLGVQIPKKIHKTEDSTKRIVFTRNDTKYIEDVFSELNHAGATARRLHAAETVVDVTAEPSEPEADVG